MTDKRALLNLGLAVVVAGLGALIWFSPEPPAEDADQPLAFPGVATATRLAVLERDPTGGELSRTRWALEQRDGTWWLTAPLTAAADPIAVEDLIKSLSAARSRAQYTLPELDAKAIGIDRPGSALLVTSGGTEARYELGGTEALNYRRYVRSGDAVQLVDDLISYRLQQDAATLISKRLLPAGAKVTQVELPGRPVARGADGKWTLRPDDAEVTADALVGLAENWQRASASAVHLRKDGVVQAVIKVTLEGAATPLEFQVLTAVEGLRFARPDLGLEYELPATAQAELLALPRTVTLPAAAPASAKPAATEP